MHRAYLASPIFNAEQLAVVRTIKMTMHLLEYKVFSPYDASRDIWKGRAPKDCTEEERGQVLDGNIKNLHWADTLVAWVGGTEDGKTDAGVVWEMGHFNAVADWRRVQRDNGTTIDPAYGFCLAYIHPTDKRQHMNLMLAGTVDAVAYGPAQLHRALEGLREGNMAAACVRVHELFHPKKHLLHEKEPIV